MRAIGLRAAPTALGGLPRPLDVELLRPRLVQRLEKRWERPVTLVVAGAGFGKTTVLAQTVRAHLLAPRGLDAWVSCEAAHEDPAQLAQALLDAMATGPGRSGQRWTAPGTREVVNAMIGLAPLEVCLLLDDVHEIPAGSPGAALLREVATALPTTAHLVLSGREVPELALARREAAGEVVALGGEELAFTEVEVAALARRLGRDASLAAALQGWPALVRLVFAAGASAPWQYAREEILNRLPDRQRQALAALAALGNATACEVAAVIGEPVALDDLARRIPLVRALDDGRYRAHDLWTDALSRTMTAQATRILRERAAAILAARGDLARAGLLAYQAQDWQLLAGLAVELVHTTLSALPRAIAERWLGVLPSSVADEPAFVLLRAAVMHAGDFTDPRIDALLDQAWHGMLDRHDEAGTAAALGQAVITAHSRADLTRLAVLTGRADLDATSSPVLTLLGHNVAAMHAEVDGDPEAALAHLVQAPVLDVPPALALSTWRFHYHCLNMCGHSREAAELADRTLGDASDVLVQLSGSVARWLDGDPSDLARLRGPGRVAAGIGSPATVEPAAATAREVFVATALAAVIASSCGDAPLLSPRPCGDPADHDNPRDAMLASVAQAAVAVARGDEHTARQTYARHLVRWPVEVRFGERHLRRFLALGYVLSDRLRAHWDSVELGPSHRAARAAARALLQARAGDLAQGAAAPSPAHVLCFLPLPWSVELAARLTAAGDRGGLELGRRLADVLGPAAHRQFRRTAQATERSVAAGAAQLLAVLPAPPAHRTRIDVMGTMRLARDGVLVDAPQLRRMRVRQLLGVLALRPVLGRDQVIDLLWPRLDPAKAARNLRVTLTHVRRLLEPDRAGGDASFHLRTDGDTIRLVPSDSLSTDLWTFNQLEAGVDRARASGDMDHAADLLGDAVALWRGDPLCDLRGLADPDVAIEIGRVRTRHVRDLLDLGELRLVAGAAAEAGHLADRALSLEPFDPRGHRLALATALRGRDAACIATARHRVLAALRELAVSPDPATAILLRQALPPSPVR